MHYHKNNACNEQKVIAKQWLCSFMWFRGGVAREQYPPFKNNINKNRYLIRNFPFQYVFMFGHRLAKLFHNWIDKWWQFMIIVKEVTIIQWSSQLKSILIKHWSLWNCYNLCNSLNKMVTGNRPEVIRFKMTHPSKATLSKHESKNWPKVFHKPEVCFDFTGSKKLNLLSSKSLSIFPYFLYHHPVFDHLRWEQR